MNKKYEMIPEGGLFRIKALRDIPSHGIKTGDLGGLIQEEHNLSQDGDCWVWRNARVYENARVSGDAKVTVCLYIQQPRHDITATDTHCFIGCEGHTWEDWFKNIAKIGDKHRYSEEEISDTYDLLKMLHKQIKHQTRNLSNAST